MIDRVKKYFSYLMIFSIIVLLGVLYYQKKQNEKKLTELHNQLALQSQTIEIHKNLYEKQSLELSNLQDVLKSFEDEHGLDQKTIKELRKQLKDREEDILAANRLALKWKKAYEDELNAHQEEVPTNPNDTENPGPMRTKVSFEKDFGYIGVHGYTLTNPAYAWISINQNRPLLLTLAITQSKDGQWNTYVTSSEENMSVDVKLAAVNPYLFQKKWYQKISLDFGMDLHGDNIFPYTAITYPIGKLSLSAGLSGTQDNGAGWFSSVKYSWNIFE